MYAPITATVLAITIGMAIAWPPKVPYVTRKGSDVHETIWLWRVPAYADHPAWKAKWMRWSWTDPLHVKAYCFDPDESAAYRAAHLAN